MTRFEELKAKQDKKQITIDDMLELLELYRTENDYLRDLITVTRQVPKVLQVKPSLENVICIGVGYFARDILK
jgi:hypothetical protein